VAEAVRQQKLLRPLPIDKRATADCSMPRIALSTAMPAVGLAASRAFANTRHRARAMQRWPLSGVDISVEFSSLASPVSSRPHPTSRRRRPMARNPYGARLRWRYKGARYPDVSAFLPAPITRVPDEAGHRNDRRHLDLRRWRRYTYNNTDFGAVAR